MTHIEQAIKDAVEKGQYRPTENWFRGVLIENNGFLLDPSFWQALGKARGWEKWFMPYKYGMTEWQGNWHRFIDHLAEGGDSETFFKNLV